MALVCSEMDTAHFFERSLSSFSELCFQKVWLFQFHCKTRPSGLSLESPGLENIPQVPGNRAEVGQNYDGRKVVSATLALLK